MLTSDRNAIILYELLDLFIQRASSSDLDYKSYEWLRNQLVKSAHQHKDTPLETFIWRALFLIEDYFHSKEAKDA